MSNTINGKKPLSAKQGPTGFGFEHLFGNELGLSPDMTSAITNAGMAYRFIDYGKLKSMGGYHERGWRPITREELKKLGCANMDTHSFILGSDADGLIRRGTLCLAVRPIEIHHQHKAWLRERADAQSNVQRSHAQKLRKSAAQGVQIREGYEDEEQK